MTLVYRRGLDEAGVPTGPGVHAFVLGVACYPDAKRGRGALAALRNVKDLPSAANSALLVVDWLVTHQDDLSGTPLASVELLANGHGTSGYAPTHQLPAEIDAPDRANVIEAGKTWIRRCRARPGAVAMFFSCGHGAIDGDDTTIFLSDLNADSTSPWSKLNVRETARAFKMEDTVAAAHFFVDACQEFIPSYQLAKTGTGAQFTDERDPFAPAGDEKVTLITAAAPGALTYEGSLAGAPKVQAGRFTQTILRALDGAAARDLTGSGDWVVHPGAVFEDLKYLYRLRPEWRDRPFDPTPREIPNEILPIVSCATPPQVPILVRTDPGAAIASLALSVYAPSKQPPPMHACAPGQRDDWEIWVPASLDSHWLVARDTTGAVYENRFTPTRSLFMQLLKVPR